MMWKGSSKKKSLRHKDKERQVWHLEKFLNCPWISLLIAYKMTCFLLRDGRRHKINAFLLLCGHKFSKLCGCGRDWTYTLRERAVMVRNSAWTVPRRALHCGTRKPNNSGNTSSMATYLKQHHRCFTNESCSITAYHRSNYAAPCCTIRPG